MLKRYDNARTIHDNVTLTRYDDAHVIDNATLDNVVADIIDEHHGGATLMHVGYVYIDDNNRLLRAMRDIW